MEDTIKEASDKLKNISKGHRSKVKNEENAELTFEFTTENGDFIKYDSEELPDLPVILKELGNPEELKMEVSKNGIVKQTIALLKKPKPIQQSQPIQQFPPNYYPQVPAQNQSIEIREVLGTMERITGNFLDQTKQVIQEMKNMTTQTIEEIKKSGKEQIEEKEKFYKDLLEEQRNHSKFYVEGRIKEESEFWSREIQRREDHNKAIRDLEMEKIKTHAIPDSSSRVVNTAKDIGGVIKSSIEGFADVIENHGDTIMRAVELTQAMKANPVNGVSQSINIPGVN